MRCVWLHCVMTLQTECKVEGICISLGTGQSHFLPAASYSKWTVSGGKRDKKDSKWNVVYQRKTELDVVFGNLERWKRKNKQRGFGKSNRLRLNPLDRSWMLRCQKRGKGRDNAVVAFLSWRLWFVAFVVIMASFDQKQIPWPWTGQFCCLVTPLSKFRWTNAKPSRQHSEFCAVTVRSFFLSSPSAPTVEWDHL